MYIGPFKISHMFLGTSKAGHIYRAVHMSKTVSMLKIHLRKT